MKGDLIPWTVGQQFQDTEFPHLSGARIVRIAAHPEVLRAGYGTHAVQLLCHYYQQDILDLHDDTDHEPAQQINDGSKDEAAGKAGD